MKQYVVCRNSFDDVEVLSWSRYYEAYLHHASFGAGSEAKRYVELLGDPDVEEPSDG